MLLAVLRGLLVPLALVAVVIEPLWRYRVHRWEVTEDAVYTLEGWLTRTWRIVPISRIQTVDTTRGPLQQLLGLTSIRVRTASHAGSTSIEQLRGAAGRGGRARPRPAGEPGPGRGDVSERRSSGRERSVLAPPPPGTGGSTRARW